MLHDIGVIVDYHDHHKHGFYLILNAGLPGFAHRELALVALLVRAHRKSPPNFDWMRPVLEDGDEERFWRLASCLRLAEQLERDRAAGRAGRRHRRARQDRHNDPPRPRGAVRGALVRGQEGPVFERAFGRRLRLVGPGAAA